METMKNNSDLTSLKAHLNQLSKEEIIDLIFEYVPADHLRSINNTRIDRKEALLVFEEVKNRLASWFDDEEFIREPYDLEGALPYQLDLLRGLELQILSQLPELIFIVMDKVCSALDKGYLYDNREDYCFQFPDEFIKLVSFVTNNLPDDQKEAFRIQMQSVLANGEYSTFDVFQDQIENLH